MSFSEKLTLKEGEVVGKRQKQLDENLSFIMMSDDNWPTVHKTLCFQINHFDCMHRHKPVTFADLWFTLLKIQYDLCF